jgi:autotransporter-associated beta strand protein
MEINNNNMKLETRNQSLISFKNTLLMAGLLLAMSSQSVLAEERTIDISGDNKADNYLVYNNSISVPAGDIVNAKINARYCYFSSTISGSGVLNIYGGGDRCFLGGEKGKTWPNWTNYTGDVHIYKLAETSYSAGFYGVVLAYGGKSSSPENALADVKSGKVNPSMANNRVTLHDGATMVCETSTNGAGFRIGELNTEAGSTLQGYYKKSRSVYYLLGGLNTDATLAGIIKPTDYDDGTLLSIIKEGSGTYSITGNNNYLSGALRILQGRVLVMNDRAEAESKQLRGALGAKPNDTDAIAYVFSKGVLGGTGSIGGMVDNYGTIEPGADGIGVLTLKNYAADLATNLTVRPSSRLRFKVAAANSYDQLLVNGSVNYNNITEDFSTSDKMPVIELALEQTADIAIGTEFRVLTVNSKTAGDWHFDVRANKYTWVVEERQENDNVVFVVRLESYADMEIADDPDEDDEANDPIYTMGAFYDDGISDTSDKNTLKYYADQNHKSIGVALCTYKGLDSDRTEAARQFNMMVCENEMKMDALQPSKASFSFGSADNLVSLAQQNNMKIRGHCLVWHSQVPGWLSSDGKKNDKNWTREEALEIMKNHITQVMTHYKGKVREWDVVNECLDDDQTTVRSNPNSYDLRQQSVWQRAIGDDYIDSAFVYAHRADPDAILYLNDYGVELQGKAKSLAFYNLAVSLKEKGIPIHGVGLQCHFSVGEVDGVKLNRTIKRFAEAGLKCIITELDMGIPSTTATNKEEQARLYRMITDIVLKNDNCPSMVIWGIKDNDSWRSGSNPLLYDSGMGKKPAWYGVRSALRHRALSTGVSEKVIVNSDKFATAPIYDLQGRKVTSQLKSGLYIKDGKKFVVK